MCTAGQRVSLTITGSGPYFFLIIPFLHYLSPSISLLLSMDTADLAFEKLRQGTTLGKNVIRIIDSETDYLADTSVVSVSGRSSSN